MVWKRNSVGGSWVGYGYGCLEELESGRWSQEPEVVVWNVYQSPVYYHSFGVVTDSIALDISRARQDKCGIKMLNLGR